MPTPAKRNSSTTSARSPPRRGAGASRRTESVLPNVGRRESEVYRTSKPQRALLAPHVARPDRCPCWSKSADRTARPHGRIAARPVRPRQRRGDDQRTEPHDRRWTGSAAFGTNREHAGMMGGATFDIAMECVRNAIEVVARDGLDLQVLAVAVYARQNASARSSTPAPMRARGIGCAWDPYLAIRTKHHDPICDVK